MRKLGEVKLKHGVSRWRSRICAGALSLAIAFAMPAITVLADAPSAAPTVTAAAGNGDVVLSWGTVQDATAYTLYQYAADGVTLTSTTVLSTSSSDAHHVKLSTDGATATYDVTGLSYGATYGFQVSATTGAGEGALSTLDTITLMSAPANLTATAGNGTIALKWDAAAADAYEISYGTTAGDHSDDPGSVDTIPGDSTGVTLTGLQNGTTYYILVTAEGENKGSATAAEVSGTPAVTSSVSSAAKVTGYTISTGHTGTNQMGTDDQYILLDVTYDRAIQLDDAGALVKEISAVYAGTDLEATTYAADQSVSADGKTLQLKFHFPFAGYGQDLLVASTNLQSPVLTSVVDQASGEAVSFPAIHAVVNNGLDFKTVSQTVGTSDTAASVTKSVVRLDSATRGMYHAVLLKNGVPMGSVDSYNANLTSHFHLYLPMGSTPAMTASDVAAAMASAVNGSFGGSYTATSDGGNFTVAEKTPSDGDVLDVLFMAYPRTGEDAPDLTALEAGIAKAEAADLSDYSAADAAALQDQLAIAKSIAASTYYLQSEVDVETKALQAALAAVAPVPSGDASAADSIVSVTDSPSETSTVPNPPTGYESPVSTAVFFVIVSAGAVLALSANRRKRR